jgi:hypothetical protein
MGSLLGLGEPEEVTAPSWISLILPIRRGAQWPIAPSYSTAGARSASHAAGRTLSQLLEQL